jgi:hypothetical protein
MMYRVLIKKCVNIYDNSIRKSLIIPIGDFDVINIKISFKDRI